MSLFGAAHGREGGGKKSPLPQISHAYLAMMKFGAVIPYLKKLQKTYKSRKTFFEFC